MQIAISPRHTTPTLFGKLREILERARHEIQRVAVYSRTMQELSELDDRELLDLDLSRTDLRALAWEQARK